MSETKISLVDYGFALPRGGLARNEEEAIALAVEIGFPVVLKIESHAIPHKTDVGGVALEVNSEEAARLKYREILRSVAVSAPLAPIEGVRVEEMISEGVE
jgi:acetyltransferase